MSQKVKKVDALSNTVRYRCAFCKKHFNKISECAKHLEDESATDGMTSYVSDIETVYRAKGRWVTL